MRIGIIGFGRLGALLARHFAREHEIKVFDTRRVARTIAVSVIIIAARHLRDERNRPHCVAARRVAARPLDTVAAGLRQ